jgi:hypothetical protein
MSIIDLAAQFGDRLFASLSPQACCYDGVQAAWHSVKRRAAARRGFARRSAALAQHMREQRVSKTPASMEVAALRALRDHHNARQLRHGDKVHSVFQKQSVAARRGFHPKQWDVSGCQIAAYVGVGKRVGKNGKHENALGFK